MWNFLVVTMAALAPLMAAAQATHPAPGATAGPAPGLVEGWIAQLGHPRYSVRENATAELCELEESHLPVLVERYQAERRYEPKRRIRYVIEYIFHRGQIAGRNGFMGVQVHPQVMPDLTDPVTGGVTRGVLVKKVISGFPAERAGLADHDVITGLERQPIPDDPSTISFVQKVGSHAPGTVLKLHVLRAAENRKVQITLGDEPSRLFANARLGMLTLDVLSPPQGVWIMSLGPGAAAAAGLKPNEIIRSVEGVPIGTSGASQIESILKARPPGSDAAFEVTATRLVEINIRLGSRPPELNDTKDMAEARARFLAWWGDRGGDLPSRPGDGSLRFPFGVLPPPRIGIDSTLVP